MKVSKMIRRILSLVLIIMTVACAVIPASAANTCQGMTGNANSSKSFTVKTSDRWFLTGHSLTFKHDNLNCGLAIGADKKGNKKTAFSYGYYTIYVEDQKTGKTKSYSWNAKWSKTIKLSSSRTYRITVKPDNSKVVTNFKQWSSVVPVWYVTKTKEITTC